MSGLSGFMRATLTCGVFPMFPRALGAHARQHAQRRKSREAAGAGPRRSVAEQPAVGERGLWWTALGGTGW
jgi:hypothetical protein